MSESIDSSLNRISPFCQYDNHNNRPMNLPICEQSLNLLSPNLPMKITDLSVLDLRFPTSRDQVGSDAVHTDPDYSAAYVILETDEKLEGHGLTFTIGRGNEV